MILLECTVPGVPAPQGSKRHVGAGRMVESSAKVRPWREAVKWAAADAVHGPIAAADGPVSVTVTYFLERPKSHWGAGRNLGLVKPSAPSRPAVKPDLDKLDRSTLDALGEIGLWRDDAQVVRLNVEKVYCDATEPPGARIVVMEVPG